MAQENWNVGSRFTGPLHPLGQLAVLVSARMTQVAEANGVTPMQARMLGALHDGPRGMAELAQFLSIEKAALTGLVNRAEDRGLVARQPVPGNRRSMHVAATPAGAEASQAFYTELAERLDEIIATLPARDRETFRSWTRALVDAADL
ncbi:MarR family winged helix-turn-helix transcriptional regulator [Kineosporia succinea]|uniref:DNA-binding MarR family transcriptional regulator n=1 Tax=Kineosporia succinea TaxID=84632 RepID=A0ABT9PCC2_9ACTN|nr:MarR family transcriptional regulator [Kineosporia succinea]MDP9830348.1 DNA-binding MarR family transcriptional regulator [Kineosporia succinea]